jgi:hypothetical protein
MVTIDGNDVVVRIREAGDSTWKTLVCEVDETIELTNDVTETDTKCGPAVGVKVMKGNCSGNGVCHADPSSTEVTWNDIANWQTNRTALEFLMENEAFTAENGTNVAEGATIHVFAPGKFVQSTLTAATGEVVKFAWTFKPTSTPSFSGTSSQ